MGSLTTGIGLISGIDTATLIDQLIALEGRGRTSLQTRVAILSAQQSALLDINARLLNLKTTAQGLRTNNVFQSALTTSSNESVLTATATGSAQPGTFSFLVKQLVSSSQKVSAGFADRDTTPVGLSSLSFEIGAGFLSSDTELAELRGGAGIDRGDIVITDSAGNTSTIDMGTVTTVSEVLDAINSDTTVKVTAAVEGDHLVVTDTAGGAGALTIADAVGDTTATDLGIAGTVAGPGPVLTGSDIRTLGNVTALSSLNDGAGVVITDANPDLTITTRNGRVFDVDLGRIDNPITTATLIEDLNDGQGVTLNIDSTEDIEFIDRDGGSHRVDLTGIVTVQDLMDRVNDQSDGAITITIHADGDKLTVNDTTGGSGNLKVLGAGPNGTSTADDLGILETAGVPAASFDGDVIPNADHTPAAKTIKNVIDRINNAKDTLGLDNAGHIVASIAPDGVSLQVQDTVGGGPAANFTITSTAANPYAARDLGLEKTGDAGGVIDGDRLIAGLNSVLVRSLNGGAGLSGNDSLAIQDRDGNSDLFTLDEDGSVSDILAQINASGAINVEAEINEAGNGLRINDLTGNTAFNLEILGSAAAELKIDTGVGGVADDTFRGGDLEVRYVAEATSLAALNYGRGIGLGEFRITDGEGDQVTIEVDDDIESVFDLITLINAQVGPDVDVTARVNDTGDGIQLDNDLGSGLIQVDSISGTTAKDLNILGQASTDGGPIDGSYEKQLQLNTSDTLDEIVQAIIDSGLPVSASVLNTGVGSTPFQLVISSKITGTEGDLLIDDGGFGLGFTTLSEAKDAKVFFGAEDPADATLIKRSSNTVSDVLPGVTLNLVSASDTPVQLTVDRDADTIEDKVAEFVAAFNDAVGTIDRYDFFDTETEERGILLGNSTTAQIRNALFRTVQQKAVGVTGEFQYLSQIGITVGADGVLEFDRGKFRDAYEDDPDSVEELFTAFKGTTTTTQEIAPGITITDTQQTFSELGFGDLFDQLMEGLTNSIDGTLTLASDGIQDQIDLTNDRIDRFDDRLQRRREQLQREFAAMETALAQLQSQSNALLSLVNNIGLTAGLLGF